MEHTDCCLYAVADAIPLSVFDYLSDHPKRNTQLEVDGICHAAANTLRSGTLCDDTRGMQFVLIPIHSAKMQSYHIIAASGAYMPGLAAFYFS